MKQFLKFAVVGGIGTVINVAILYALTHYLGVYYIYSAVVAFLVAMSNNFVLNKLWTFEEELQHAAASRFIKFFFVSVVSLGINLLCLWIFTEFFGIFYVVSQVLAIGVGLVINFFGNKLWTFQKNFS